MGNSQSVGTQTNALQLTQWLKQRVAATTGLSVDDVDENIPLTRYGLDSSAMLTLACDLEDHLNIEFEHESLYEQPTISAIVKEMVENRLNKPS